MMKPLFLLLLLMLCPLAVVAQDAKPTGVKSDVNPLAQRRQMHQLHGLSMGDTEFEFTPTAFPRSFVHIQANHLLNADALTPFFDKVAERRSRSVRVVQIGDSHIRGHVLPRELRYRLEEAWGSEAMERDKMTYQTTAIATETGTPGFVFHALSKNGVQLSYFQDEQLLQQITALHPDLLIISVGTNEAHDAHFSGISYQQQLDQFLKLVSSRSPGVQFLITTPPGSHVGSARRVKRRGRWVSGGGLTPNPRTPEVVGSQLEFAASHNIPLWNLYELGGGSSYACENWRSANLMTADGVHFSHEAYTLQGRMLAEAILKEWNNYLKRP